MGNAKKNVLN